MDFYGYCLLVNLKQKTTHLNFSLSWMSQCSIQQVVGSDKFQSGTLQEINGLSTWVSEAFGLGSEQKFWLLCLANMQRRQNSPLLAQPFKRRLTQRPPVSFPVLIALAGIAETLNMLLIANIPFNCQDFS